MIAEEYAGGGTTSLARRAHTRRARYEEVFTTYRATPGTRSHSREHIITFSEKDEEGVLRPHDNALVMTMQIAKYWIRSVLIDNGSSAGIIFWEAFIWMGITLDQLRLAPTPLKGFARDMIQPIKAITLSILARTASRMAATMVDFLVVKSPSSYNAILGRPTLNHLRAVTSTYYLKVKFSTPIGVGKMHGEQKLARECYAREMKLEAIEVQTLEGVREDAGLPPALALTELDKEVRDEKALWKVEPKKPLQLVSVDLRRREWTVWVRTKMTPELSQSIKQLLIEHQDVFALSHKKMPGIDMSIIEHRLSVNPKAK